MPVLLCFMRENGALQIRASLAGHISMHLLLTFQTDFR